MRILQISSLCALSAITSLVCTPLSSARAPFAKTVPLDFCSLLSPGKLQEILGQPFGAPEKTTAPPTHQGQPSGWECDYQARTGLPRKVVFIAYADPSASQAKESFDKLSSWFTSRPRGIGDSAYIDDNHAIHVMKGRVRYYLNIVPFGSVTAENEKHLRDLAVWVAMQI